MIVTFLSWVYIFIAALLTGLLIRKALRLLFSYDIKDPDTVIVSGIAFMTVFAEYWSIFGGVGRAANIALAFFCLVSIIINRQELKDVIKDIRRIPMYCFALTAVLAIVFAALSSDIPEDYDTYLYHAQSIEWINRYGLVKGLANLHNRFGYNSAFMCLQALFKSDITGHSLHQMNGFFCLFMAVFSCADNFITKKRHIEAEDILKLSACFYILYAIKSISSSGSDIMTMLLLLYLFIKWTQLSKTDVKNAVPYGLLAVFAVFLSTVKLSAAPCVLLALYPLFFLIKEKRTVDIVKFVALSVITGLPFIIRNVLISGYLIYPMESLDLFDPDWKVPAEVCRVDRIDIMKFGRGINGLDGDFSLTGWLQVWFRSLEFVPRLIVCIGMISLAVFVIMLVKAAVKKDRQALLRAFVTGVSGAGFLYWLLSSPLMRYGIVVVLIFNAVTIGLMLDEKSRRVYTVFLVCCMFFMLSGLSDNYKGKQINMIFPEDYASFECKEVELPAGSGSVTVYMPAEGDQSGVDVFPATPEINPDYTELRGRDFSEGFRDKMSNRK